MSALTNDDGGIARNRRYWPRMHGGVTLFYRVVEKQEWEVTARAWMSSLGPAPFNAGFHSPDPFMEFSAGGLCFHDVERLQAGDLLVCSLAAPPSSTPYHVTARVVRVAEIAEEDREGGSANTRSVAIEFLDISQRATLALIEYTEKLQDFEIMTTADIVTADIHTSTDLDDGEIIELR